MKNILITGINRGLGAELFNQLTDKGYFVFGLLRNSEAYKRLLVRSPSNAELILADITKDESVAIIQHAVKERPIHLLINNAGIGGISCAIANIEPSELNDLFNVHCVGSLRIIKALEKNLLKAHNPTVININSRLGSIERQAQGVYQNIRVSYSYRIAKAAQNMLTVCLRNEYSNKIKIISIHPGKLKTQIAQEDANLEPAESAKMIIDFWENNKLREENGILELPKTLIEW